MVDLENDHDRALVSLLKDGVDVMAGGRGKTLVVSSGDVGTTISYRENKKELVAVQCNALYSIACNMNHKCFVLPDSTKKNSP